jgi:hypothetical protein
LFQYDDAKTVARERERGGQSADAGAGNDDHARGRQGTPPAKLQTVASCKAHSAGRAAFGASVGSWR